MILLLTEKSNSQEVPLNDSLSIISTQVYCELCSICKATFVEIKLIPDLIKNIQDVTIAYKSHEWRFQTHYTIPSFGVRNLYKLAKSHKKWSLLMLNKLSRVLFYNATLANRYGAYCGQFKIAHKWWIKSRIMHDLFPLPSSIDEETRPAMSVFTFDSNDFTFISCGRPHSKFIPIDGFISIICQTENCVFEKKLRSNQIKLQLES